MEKSTEAPQRIKIESSYNLAFPLLGIYLKVNENTNSKETHTPVSTKASFTWPRHGDNLNGH